MTARGFLLLFGHAASRAFVGRRGIALLLLAAMPAALAWIQVRFDPGVSTTGFVATILIFAFQFLVPLAGLFLGVATLGDEIEGRTLTYLFTRPYPRPLVFAARYLGLAVAFAMLLAGALAVAAYIYSSRVPITAREAAATAGIAVLGFLVYAAFFATMRLFVQRALFVGFILGFMIEGFVSKIPRSGLSSCSVWHHLALLEVRLFDGQITTAGEMRKLLLGIGPEETVSGSLWVLGSILAVSLVVGLLRVRARETRLANVAT